MQGGSRQLGFCPVTASCHIVSLLWQINQIKSNQISKIMHKCAQIMRAFMVIDNQAYIERCTLNVVSNNTEYTKN